MTWWVDRPSRQRLAYETDKTVEASEPIHFNGLVFVDLPGYGTAMFRKKLNHFTKFDLTESSICFCVAQVASFDSGDTEFFRRLVWMIG